MITTPACFKTENQFPAYLSNNAAETVPRPASVLFGCISTDRIAQEVFLLSTLPCFVRSRSRSYLFCLL